MAQIAYIWLNEDIIAQNYPLHGFFFEMVKKFYDASHVHFLALFTRFFWSLFDISLHLRWNLINLGKLQMLFWCRGGRHPYPHLARVPDITLIWLRWKNSTTKYWQIFWQLFLQKLFFLTFIFSYLLKYFQFGTT